MFQPFDCAASAKSSVTQCYWVMLLSEQKTTNCTKHLHLSVRISQRPDSIIIYYSTFFFYDQPILFVDKSRRVKTLLASCCLDLTFSIGKRSSSFCVIAQIRPRKRDRSQGSTVLLP